MSEVKKFILFTLFILIFASCLFAQTNLAVGTIRKPIMTDASGNVVSTNIVISNQWVMVPVPTASNHIARIMDVTNTPVVSLALTNGFSRVPWLSITNAVRTFNIITNTTFIPISNGGTSTNTTLLTGSWTNTINFTTSGTNNANAFSVKGILGFTGSITNLGPGVGSSNVSVYTTGILTNKFTIP